MSKKIAIIFTNSIYTDLKIREGLDLTLAFSNFYSTIEVFFIEQGILNIYPEQQANLLLMKNISKNFKLIDLYQINRRYICQDSVQKLLPNCTNWLIDVVPLTYQQILIRIKRADLIFQF